MVFTTSVPIRRRVAAVSAPLVVLSLLLVVTGCKTSTDWNRFDRNSVQGSLEALADAEARFETERSANGLAAAVAKAKTELEAHASVQAVAVSSDSSITAQFKNGLLGCIFNIRESMHRTAPTPTPGRVRAALGGETPSPYFILSPFSAEFGNNDPSGYIADKLREFLDPTSATQVYEYYDATVTVDVVRTAMMASVLYWAGHGGFVSVEPGNLDMPGLLTGEGGDPAAIARRVVELEDQGYTFSANGGWQLFTIAFHGKTWIGILPGFVTSYGDFDRFEGMQTNRTKSIAYISCCNSWRMRDAFQGKGVDAYLGWSASVSDEFSNSLDGDLFCNLCDTFTVQEAYDALGNQTEPGGASLYMQGDGNVMLRSAGRFTVDGSNVKCYMLICTVDDDGVTVLACNDGLGQVGQVQVEWPGGSTGTFDVSQVDDAVLVWIGYGSMQPYIAQKDWQGVGGSINVTRYDAGVVSGTFSGTLGWWPPEANPREDPPSQTVTIGDGYFKYSGKRIQSK
jgi:hypothetical protein